MLPKKLRLNSGVTIIEILLVLVIIGVVFVPMILTFRTTRNNQALRSSASEVADILRNYHVFAREAKDKSGWGVKSTSTSEYAVLRGKKDAYVEDSKRVLESGVSFESGFFIWFDVGTGELEGNQKITLVGDNGKYLEITIYKTGVIETGNII